MTDKWYDHPLEPKPGGEVETPLGVLKITVEEQYSVYAELTEFITINRILCRVTVNSRLSLQREEWIHSASVDRIMLIDPPRYGQTWRTSGSATNNARKKARVVILPLLEHWLDDHLELIEQGKHIADRNLIQRAHYRLDDALREIEQRRAELVQMLDGLEQNGTLKAGDRQLLGDLWGHHWRF